MDYECAVLLPPSVSAGVLHPGDQRKLDPGSYSDQLYLSYE